MVSPDWLDEAVEDNVEWPRMLTAVRENRPDPAIAHNTIRLSNRRDFPLSGSAKARLCASSFNGRR